MFIPQVGQLYDSVETANTARLSRVIDINAIEDDVYIIGDDNMQIVIGKESAITKIAVSFIRGGHSFEYCHIIFSEDMQVTGE